MYSFCRGGLADLGLDVAVRRAVTLYDYPKSKSKTSENTKNKEAISVQCKVNVITLIYYK